MRERRPPEKFWVKIGRKALCAFSLKRFSITLAIEAAGDIYTRLSSATIVLAQDALVHISTCIQLIVT